MTKRTRSLAMAESMPPSLTSPCTTVNGTDSQSPTVLSYSRGGMRLSRPKKHYPSGNRHQLFKAQSKLRTHGHKEKPINISSSESDWSTSPQILSTRDMSKSDSPGMTLKIIDVMDDHCPSEYWLQLPAPHETLLGCGSWQQDELQSEIVPSISFEDAMLCESSETIHNKSCSPHDDGAQK